MTKQRFLGRLDRKLAALYEVRLEEYGNGSRVKIQLYAGSRYVAQIARPNLRIEGSGDRIQKLTERYNRWLREWKGDVKVSHPITLTNEQGD